MDSEKIDISFIIVNYRTPLLTKDCIASIYALNCKCSYEIIVVDNFSCDDSYTLVTKDFKNIQWIDSQDNLGFGRANNLAVSKAKGEYILLVNSDVVFTENSIDYYLDCLKKDSTIGVLGCKLLNEDRTLQKSTYYDVGQFKSILKYNIVFDYLFSYKPRELDAVMGAFMLMKRSVFNESGGFDPDFFMYAEELELCKRIKKRGYTIVYNDKYSAVHKIGGSSDGMNWTGRQNWLSNALLFLKIRGYLGYFIYHILWGLNFSMNFFILWKMSKEYRIDYRKSLSLYFFNWLTYWTIPFTFTRKLGTGKKLLKSA